MTINPLLNENANRLKIAYETLLGAGAHTPSAGLRELIVQTELIGVGFGVCDSDCETVTCDESELHIELLVAAAPLVKVSDELQDILTGEIEDLLARFAPKAAILYAVRTKLWQTAPDAWARLMGQLLLHVQTPESGLAITAVIAERISNVKGSNEA